jgi:hypothetical protein
MNNDRTFIVFQRTSAHCSTWFVRADSPKSAMAAFCVHDTVGAELLEDGSISYPGCGNAHIVYGNPLECIESEMKSYDGLCGHSWEIRELREEHWRASIAEVFCSADPDDVEGHIRQCRPLFRASFPRSRARAFVWYLNSGPLISFHRRKDPACRTPIEILARYHIAWNDRDNVVEWRGTHNDILARLAVEYPLPV